MSHPTEPNMNPVGYRDGVPAPPRFLLWGVILLFVLIVGGFFAGLYIFNNVLTSGQQVRVVTMFPFMEALQKTVPTPAGGIVPTVELDDESNDAALDLLSMPVLNGTPTPAASTQAEVTEAIEPAVEESQSGMALPTLTPLPTNTPLPTLTPLPTNTPLPTSAPMTDANSTDMSSLQVVSYSDVPGAHRNTGFVWDLQTWNNCGPATITMGLSYFGWRNDQDYARDRLRPNREDKNVSPHELVEFVEEYTDVEALYRIGGTTELLQALIAGGFPVIIERGIRFEAYDWTGHYQALVAYDNSSRIFYAYDSFLGNGSAGEGIIQRYDQLDEGWQNFNRTFIVIYHPDAEQKLRSILGPYWDEQQAAAIAFDQAQAEALANQNDGYAWFNMGTALTIRGDYQRAANAYDRALREGIPWRILWYQFGPFKAYYNVGRYDDVISLAQSALNQAAELEESYYWRGLAYAQKGDLTLARTDLNTALRYNPNFVDARSELDRIGG